MDVRISTRALYVADRRETALELDGRGNRDGGEEEEADDGHETEVAESGIEMRGGGWACPVEETLEVVEGTGMLATD